MERGGLVCELRQINADELLAWVAVIRAVAGHLESCESRTDDEVP
ncbi:MAG TPA: hypothetical protein PLZ60_12625 [Kiritimatiellia bacterium]|mgnify:CR=1 FL=1|nr:hypothetical protein [Kiritimatiellia bacterium]